MKLKHMAHARTGDKGNWCNICIIPFNPADYEKLKNYLTTEVVKHYYQQIC